LFLSVHSAIATLLSLTSQSNCEFSELVVQKLLTQFIVSLKSGDILVPEINSTNTLSLEGDKIKIAASTGNRI
jgi:hypothetical protein